MLITVLMSLTPSSAGRRIAGPFAPQESVDLINKELGTDKPLPTRYVRWVGDAAIGRFSASRTRRSAR